MSVAQRTRQGEALAETVPLQSAPLHGTDGPPAASWTNVRPLTRSSAAAVGEWVDLLARISHDLRTPLNAVIGFSDVMAQELFGPLGHARYHEYVGHIRASGEELLKAAEDALEMTALLAEPRTMAIEGVPLLLAVGEALDELGGRARLLAPSIETDIAEPLEVRADRRLLTRAIRHLVSIGIARAGRGANIRIAAAVEHGLVRLDVAVSDAQGSCPVDAEKVRDLGMGRRDLGVWIASSILDQIDCRLSIEIDDGCLILSTVLEEAAQASFFDGPRRGLA